MPTADEIRHLGGEGAWTVQDRVLSLPVLASVDVRPGQVVTYLTAPADPSLEGRQFTVVADHSQTHSTARRLQVREVTGQ